MIRRLFLEKRLRAWRSRLYSTDSKALFCRSAVGLRSLFNDVTRGLGMGCSLARTQGEKTWYGRAMGHWRAQIWEKVASYKTIRRRLNGDHSGLFSQKCAGAEGCTYGQQRAETPSVGRSCSIMCHAAHQRLAISARV